MARPIEGIRPLTGRAARWMVNYLKSARPSALKAQLATRDRETVRWRIRPLSGRTVCPHGDPFCPCPDGDPCHYEGRDPMTRRGDSMRVEVERAVPGLDTLFCYDPCSSCGSVFLRAGLREADWPYEPSDPQPAYPMVCGQCGEPRAGHVYIREEV